MLTETTLSLIQILEKTISPGKLKHISYYWYGVSSSLSTDLSHKACNRFWPCCMIIKLEQNSVDRKFNVID